MKIRKTRKDPLYRKLYYLWRNMIDRCYKTSDPSYKWYGAKGVTVSEEWKTIDGFLATIDLVEGWDKEKFLDGKLSLDKDSRVEGNVIYAQDKCRFISREENNKIKPSQQKPFTAENPSGYVFEAFNQSAFAREHGLNQSTISEYLRGKIGAHKGWKFRYK